MTIRASRPKDGQTDAAHTRPGGIGRETLPPPSQRGSNRNQPEVPSILLSPFNNTNTRGRDNTAPALEQVDHVHYIQQHETLSTFNTNSLYGGQLASRHIPHIEVSE